ncbi:rod-determining factor RdfA [Natrialbaceae archaeon A-CW2]
MPTDKDEQTCGCKIGRISVKYDLTRLDEDLIRYWTGSGDERYSTRQLAKYVNKNILESAFNDAGIRHKQGEIENTYQLLTDENMSSGTRVQTRNELKQESVAIDQVEKDFISHQTVYNHLTECLGASMGEVSDEERLQRGKDTLGALQNRTIAVTDDTITRLRDNGVLNLGEFNVIMSLTILCEDCQQQYTVRDLLEQGSCDCSS